MAARVRLSRLAPGLVFAAAFVVFSGVLKNGFVNWDDPVFLTGNPHFRGFAAENLRWMLSNALQSVYQPLAWLTLALDHALWGMEPGGYHLQSLLWHCAVSVLFYFVALRLLVLSRGGSEEDNAPGALVAALLFAVHPLRTEAVAWASERRELVGDFFWLAGVLAYLRPKRPMPPTAVFLFLALSAKGTMLSLPLVLLALDFHPLKRLASWRDLRERVVEKWPLWALSVLFGLIGLSAARGSGELAASAAVWSPAQRLAQVFYGLAFYARKTLWPSGLCFLYRMPFDLRPAEPRFVLSALAVAAAAAGAWSLRRRFPAALAAAAVYAAALFPVVGVMKYGPHLAADRYSNLSCLPLAVLAGAAFLAAVRRRRAETWGLAAAVLLALAVRSAAQAATWRDSVALWTNAAAAVPDDARFHANLGAAAAERGDFATAEAELSTAHRLDPRNRELADDWALFLAGRGRWDEAVAVRPESAGGPVPRAPSRFELLRLERLARTGRRSAAESGYRAILATSRSPSVSQPLAALLMRDGRWAEAEPLLEEALAIDPADAESNVDLGLLLARAGRRKEAYARFQKALTPGSPRVRALAHYDWGNALAAEGRFDAAARHYREAARLEPRFVEPRLNLGSALARRGRYRESAAAFRAALAADPGNGAAARGLRAAESLSGRR